METDECLHWAGLALAPSIEKYQFRNNKYTIPPKQTGSVSKTNSSVPKQMLELKNTNMFRHWFLSAKQQTISVSKNTKPPYMALKGLIELEAPIWSLKSLIGLKPPIWHLWSAKSAL